MSTDAGLDAARAAKAKLAARLKSDPTLAGIGIGIEHGQYVIKVNFRTDDHPELPHTIDGVEVESEIVGAIQAY